jgi:hypothetical protein
MIICQNYGHFAKKIEVSDRISNHYLNKILDVHPLAKRCPDNIASVKN